VKLNPEKIQEDALRDAIGHELYELLSTQEGREQVKRAFMASLIKKSKEAA